MMALLTLLGCGGEASGPPIVWITLDTVSAAHMRLYGGRAEMPTLERFARDAVVFDHAYSHFPQTQQSHWTMFTSTLPEVHRTASDARTTMYAGPTIAEHLAAAGYATGGFVGGLTLSIEASGLDRGFGVYDHASAWGRDNDLRPASQVRAQALAWMAEQDRPYFAFINLFEAHSAYEPKDGKRYDPDYTGHADGSLATLARERSNPWMSPRDIAHVVALYDAELTELDQELEALFAAIPAEAIVVVTSDHGESFDHGYLFNHPEVVYDSVLHVPLLIRAPGIPARREAAQVGLMDLTPTVLQLAGLPPMVGAAGHPLLPETPPRSPLYARSRAPTGGRALLAARTPTAKGVFEEGGASWAFDLVADPGEHARTALPAELADAQTRYDALAATDLPRGLPSRFQPPAHELKERLEALGYTSAEDGRAAEHPGSRPPIHPGAPPGPPPGPRPEATLQVESAGPPPPR
ncbi:MAG: sulfatase [Pseudomonadota bacterium]|nr:sulfatase [Pseudomonadota bacterium]